MSCWMLKIRFIQETCLEEIRETLINYLGIQGVVRYAPTCCAVLATSTILSIKIN